jgi:hypothetical protein
MTLRIMAFSVMTLSINEIEHLPFVMLSVVNCYAECRMLSLAMLSVMYAEYRNTERNLYHLA